MSYLFRQRMTQENMEPLTELAVRLRPHAQPNGKQLKSGVSQVKANTKKLMPLKR
jgi:hypothetical protein